MKKTWKATFVITIEGAKVGGQEHVMTSQMARDKLLTPLQEMWILRHIDRFSIEEVKPVEVKSNLFRGNEAGIRESFYKTGFPAEKKKRSYKQKK